MSLDPFLLKVLVCPETQADLVVADADVVAAINTAIDKGTATNRAGRKVKDKIDGALILKDQSTAYAVRGDIPLLLVDEQIPLSSILAHAYRKAKAT